MSSVDGFSVSIVRIELRDVVDINIREEMRPSLLLGDSRLPVHDKPSSFYSAFLVVVLGQTFKSMVPA
jgi:hypothetical protein